MYKKLILVLVLVAALLLDAVPVYAAESDDLPFPDPVEYLKNRGDVPDWEDYRYYVVYWYKDINNDLRYLFSFSQERFIVKTSPVTSSGHKFVSVVPKDAFWNGSYWTCPDSKLPHLYLSCTDYGNYTIFNDSGFIDLMCAGSGFDFCLSDGIMYSNYNIWDEENLLVFPTAPMKGHPAVVESILGTVVTHQMMEPTMTEILGLVPSVIGLIIFCLGLRKAYQFLVTHLRQA